MTFTEYQKGMDETYSRNKWPLIYPALGLSGETGEAIEHVKKCMRNDGGVLSSERRQKLKMELGDCLWYLAALADDAGLTMEEIAQCNLVKLRDRKARNVIKSEGDNR